MSYDYYIDEEPDRRYEKIQESKGRLVQFFSKHLADVFFERQLQVLFEDEFFHWITVDALRELVGERKLQSELHTLSGNVKIRFYWSPANRYWKRKAVQTSKLVLEYSEQNFLS